MTRKQTRSTRARRVEQRARKRRQRTFIALGIVGALALVALLVVALRPESMAAEDAVLPETLAAPPNAEGKAWGPAEAPVVVEEFSDFQ